MYNAAVIGLGNIGMLYDLENNRTHPASHVMAYKLSSDYRLVCAVDNNEQRKKILSMLAPEVSYYADLDNAIKQGKLDNIDIISICTPPSTHLDIIEKLITNKIGKVVFCEKPIVSSLEEVEKLKKLINCSDITIIPNISRRWNPGLRQVAKILKTCELGVLKKINVRYTRGIYNTGAHLFDLLKMWTGSKILKVFALDETITSAYPEKTVNFYFNQEDGVTGYAEAIDDRDYYLFNIDLYCTEGKIEMRNSGDDIKLFRTTSHHLFDGFKELVVEKSESGLLSDTCLGNAVENIKLYLDNKEKLYCDINDAIYPIYVADAIEKSLKSRHFEEVKI